MWMSKAISANELFLLSYKWIMGSHFSTAEYNSIGHLHILTPLHILSLIETLTVPYNKFIVDYFVIKLCLFLKINNGFDIDRLPPQ